VFDQDIAAQWKLSKELDEQAGEVVQKSVCNGNKGRASKLGN